MNAHSTGLIKATLVLNITIAHFSIHTNRIKSANNDQRDINEPFHVPRFFCGITCIQIYFCLIWTSGFDILSWFEINNK